MKKRPFRPMKRVPMDIGLTTPIRPRANPGLGSRSMQVLSSVCEKPGVPARVPAIMDARCRAALGFDMSASCCATRQGSTSARARIESTLVPPSWLPTFA